MPPTMKNKELIRNYESHVDSLYYHREEANIGGFFQQQRDKRKRKKKIARR